MNDFFLSAYGESVTGKFDLRPCADVANLHLCISQRGDGVMNTSCLVQNL